MPVMNVQENFAKAIINEIEVPEIIKVIAGYIRNSLMYGPYYTDIQTKQQFNELIGLGGLDYLEEHVVAWEDTFNLNNCDYLTTGVLCDKFMEFIDTLPEVIYFDYETGFLMNEEPKGEYDSESDEWVDSSPYYEFNKSDIAKALFPMGQYNILTELGM